MLGERSLPILRKHTFPFTGITTGSMSTSPMDPIFKVQTAGICTATRCVNQCDDH